MSTLERAIEIAAKAHVGTKDKQGCPYILHPLRVMLRQKDETTQIIAALHDVLEDSKGETKVTAADLQREGTRHHTAWRRLARLDLQREDV